jgi:hypothetical protein
MRIYLLLAMAAGASLVGAKCGGTGVGDPCTPEDEYLTGFSGFSKSEVNVESRSFQCETRVCLVNHFQGRVSCPYGQVEDPDAVDSGLSTCMGTLEHRNSVECQPGGDLHRKSCQVPTRDGSAWEDRVVPAVDPQLQNRQAVDTVYCSCRCGGPEGADDGGASFCECPSGFVCEPLVDDMGLGKGNLAGSYCVKQGTTYDPGAFEGFRCDESTANCNSDYTIEFDDERGKRGSNQKRACLPKGAVCGKDDTCCEVSATACENGVNCFRPAECGAGGCVHPNGGGTEVTYEVTRNECDEGETC